MTQNDYVERLAKALLSIRQDCVRAFVAELVRVRESGNCVLIAGNGGSATTASHMATDLGVGSHKVGAGIRAVSLAENAGAITATANDLYFEMVFAAQVDLLGLPGDLLVVISASGNSPNLLAAVSSAKNRSMTVVSLTGFTGGRLAEVSDINIHVATDSGDYGPAEDAHLAVNHMVTEQLRAIYAQGSDPGNLHG